MSVSLRGRQRQTSCKNGHPYPESKRPGRSDCAVCHREQERARQRANGAKPRQPAGSNWSCDHNPETDMRATTTGCAICHREKQVARYHANPERHRAAASEYQKLHRDERNAYLRQWRADNAEHYRAYSRDQARRRRFGRENAEALDYITVLTGDPCCYCGDPMEHIDHIDPLARSGSNDWFNLTAACQSCNASKKDSPLLMFLHRKLARS